MVALITNGLNRMRTLRSFSYTPRWIVFLIDVALAIMAVSVAYLIWVNFQIDRMRLDFVLTGALVIVGIRVISFLLGHTYSGIVRFTGTEDALRIYYVLTAGEIALLLGSGVFFLLYDYLFIPVSVLLTEYVLLTSLMVMSRVIVKKVFAQYIGAERTKKNVIICGSDEYGIMAKHAMDNVEDATYNILAFVDVNDRKAGKIIEGVKIYKMSSLPGLLKRNRVDKVVIAKKMISPDKKREIVEICLAADVNVLEVPRFESWINGELSMRHIRNIKIEDLLERDVIHMEETNLRKQLLNKVVLVTGAAGSIGSEIVRQLTHFNPSLIVLFDQAESPLYDIELELKEECGFTDYKVEIGDVRDASRVEGIFKTYHPNIVYHAAAYKHVPLMEENPCEAVLVNVTGSRQVADMAVEYGAEKMIMVSTDKAVNPTNVMGCSKRLAEIYVQSLGCAIREGKVKGHTKFITTRFGNVLGSNGSVIPRFKEQIENGGPVTVTHPDIIRFFMTIPEACRLVMEAATMGEGNEIFVFEMGKAVKIVDLATRMIELAGYRPGEDIKIEFTGLRPGEKLYEEVLSDKENTIPTENKKIMIAKVRRYEYADILDTYAEFEKLSRAVKIMDTVRLMKKIVPEFKSKNSPRFEVLDKE